jgi:tetratricopeptide (TPR) repeat protein/CHAT domain-containing protein
MLMGGLWLANEWSRQSDEQRRQSDAMAHYDRGVALAVQWKLDEAIAEWRAAIRINPDDAKAHSNLGNALENQGKLEEAISECRVAIRIKPDLAEAHRGLGVALAKYGKLDEAIAEYRAAIWTEPNDAEAHSNLGLALAGQGKLEEAIAEYLAAIRIKPDYAKAHSNLGVALKAQGKLDEAIAEFRAVIRFKPGDASAHYNLAITLADQGKLDEAIAEFRAAIRFKPGDASAHYNLAIALADQEKLDEAIAEFRAAIRFKTDHANAHCALGTALAHRGKLDEAIAEYRAAIRIRPNDAEDHYGLGDALRAQGKLDDAVAEYRAAIRIKPDFAEAHRNLGVALTDQGKLDDAVAEYRAAIRIKPDPPATLYSLGRAPGVFAPAGHADEPPERLTTDQRQKLGRPGLELYNASNQAFERGDLTTAVEKARQHLRIMERLYPKDRYPHGHPNLATSLNNLGHRLHALGDYGGARGYFEQALAMTEALYPKDRYPQGNPHLATSLHNLGTHLRDQGDYGGARGYLERALAMFESLYSKDRYPQGHSDQATCLSNLGILLGEQGDYDGARAYLELALAMTQALYPKDRYPQGHTDLATCLHDLGYLLTKQGDYGGARGYYQRALAMTEALYPSDRYPHGHPELAATLNSLGALLAHQGEYGGARGYLGRALAMREALYPKEGYPQGHRDLAGSLHSLGYLLVDDGQLTAAWPLLQRAADMYQDEAELLQEASSEAESQDYLASLPGTIHGLLAASYRLPDKAEATYARVWRHKATIARGIHRRQAALTVRARADTDARAALESWRDARRRLARLLLATADGRDDPGRVQRLRSLTAEKERLERALAAAVPELARDRLLAVSPPARLIEALPAYTAVLDLVAFDCPEKDPKVRGEKGRRWTPRYVGFVLARGRPVHEVDLGPAGRIDEAVQTWRVAIEHRRASPAAEVLRRAVWEPLARHFPPGTTTVLIAPDGPMTGVPWGALPGDRPGTVLLEQYALATVPHVPFLLDRLTAPPRSSGAGDLVLAVGGVDYDGLPKPLGDPAARTDPLALRPAETVRGRGPRGDGWKSLPGTAREVEAVTKLAAPRSVLRLDGTEAGTHRLLRELPRARWAHIATHGFFADPNVRSILQPDPRLFAFEGGQRAAGLRNPLVLSGVVLAGANRPTGPKADRADDDLGIVTAEAIAGLPLPDLELVVLSACETGVGLVGGREGVFGLQRAFHLAGAHNVVASLWRVDDAATSILMEQLYTNLWVKKLPKLEALRQAQLAVLNDPGLVTKRRAELAKERGIGATPVKLPEGGPVGAPSPRDSRSDPSLWAAFVLSGDGR